MKRFWKEASVEARAIRLDSRPVKTPRRNPLTLPNAALADAIAAEWNAVADEIDPAAMPLTGLANAAIDIVSPDPTAFATNLAAYGETDLLCYRAESPASLVAAQADSWDPLLGWARTRYDVHFEIVTGIIHRAQPPATIARLSEAIATRDPFRLAGLSPIVTIGGSLVAALAFAEAAFDAEAVWQAVNLDELWQEERWGADSFATQAREVRRAEWDAAVRFLTLLD